MVRFRLSPTLLLVVALGCAPPEGTRPERSEPLGRVTVYDPNAASNGFTLAFHRRDTPVLVDMHGRVVHSWPEARVKTRVRLLEDCSLLAFGRGRAIVELDWRGDKVWSASFDDRLLHHDLIRLDNGHTMVLSRTRGVAADDVLELDRAGNIVWEWNAGEPLAAWIDREPRRHAGDTTHLNSLQVLPENPWHAAGDARFRPGNVLLSARNIDLVLIVDRMTGEVVWTYQGELDRQHEALMLGPESDRNGHILVFDNRYSSFHGDRRSEVIEIDPRDGSTVWSYSAPGLYSPTSGAQQPLGNGNVLIVSSQGGRALEVDRAGRAVWEWVPGFRLNRPNRYPADHCPQLAALGPPHGPPVRPSGYRHVDRDAYRFSRAGQRVEIEIDGVARQVLAEGERCATILVPDQATATLRYGVARQHLEELGPAGYRARFSLTLTNPESGLQATVFEDEVGLEGAAWRERTIDLAALALEQVEMCVGIDESGVPEGLVDGALAFWSPPSLAVGSTPEEPDDEEAPTDLTPEELEVRQEHLRAMGYVN